MTICLIMALLMTVSANGNPAKPVFHASFDRDFRAVSDKGEIEGKHSMTITMETLSMLLQNGIKGRAAKIGVQQINGQLEGSLIHYPGKYINPEAGTISFWLKPLNWDFKDNRFHIFFEAHGPDSWLTIYKYGHVQQALYFLFGRNGGKRGTDWVIAEASAAKWERGTFHHVAASWDKENIRFYLDGILRKTVKIVPTGKPRKFNLFSVGPRSLTAWKNQIGESLIDDLRVYNCTLSAGQLEELYNSYGYKKLDKSQIPVKISPPKMMISPDGKILNLTFNLTRTTQKNTGFPVEMEVILNDKKQINKLILNSSSTEYQYGFDLSKLAHGDYLLRLKPVRETPKDVIENNSFRFTVGDAAPVVDHSVPDPWNPVVLKQQDGQQVLSAKMQRTVFGKNVFPVQLYSQDVPLLRSGISFLCNGRPFSSFSGLEAVEAHPDLQVVESKGDDGQFELKSRCRFEFDGMMWFEVTLTPKGRQTVKNAKIEIPLRPEVSRLYNCFAKDYYYFRGLFLAGALDKSVKRNHYQCSDLPVIWMGNEERGLYYFTQDQSGRRLKNRAETIRLDPGKDGALLTVNLIDYDSVIEKPVTWKFGLQVTPMRPFVRNRTFWRHGKNVGLWFPWEKIHNVPDARFKEDNYKKKRSSWSNNGAIPLFHYFAGFSASPEDPGYPQHAYDWSVTPPAVGTEVSPNSRAWCYVFVCAGSASYRNMYLRNMEKCIKELKMQYLYFDNCWSQWCANKKHGCGWYDEHGKFYPSANILGSRELAKGNYRALRKQYPYGLVARHISQIPEPPLVAFADCLVDGECFVMDIGRDENYYKVFKPDFFRASFLGVQFGSPCAYIAQFNRAYTEHFPEKLPAAKAGKLKNQAKHLRHFMGYVLAHDTEVSPNFGVDAASCWNIMDKAGVRNNSPFYGYWQNDNPVRKTAPADERVMVSSYQIPTGYLTVIMNDTDHEAAVKLSLAAGGTDSAWKLTDAETGEKITGHTVSVPARDYKLVRIEKSLMKGCAEK